MKVEKKEKLKSELQDRMTAIQGNMEEIKKSLESVAGEKGVMTRQEQKEYKKLQEQMLHNAAVEEVKLYQVLIRINDPDFGVCRRCKKAMSYERLSSVPEARSCASCG